MNYFAHFIADGMPDRPYYNLGLILPDLMGIFDRKWKVNKTNTEQITDDNVKDLLAGINRHEAIDKAFHQSTFFSTNKNAIQENLSLHDFNNPPYRLFFLSHIMLELIIDRILVKEFPDKARELYNQLEHIDKQKLKDLFRQTGSEYKPGFWNFFMKFRDYRFVLNYVNDDSLIEVLNKVSQRVGHPMFKVREQENLKKVIHESEKKLFPVYKDAFKEINAPI